MRYLCSHEQHWPTGFLAERRQRGLGGWPAFGSYAFAFEPGLRLKITSYNVAPPNWPNGLTLRAAVLADIHACEPWMPAARIRAIAELANALEPDIIFLLGDFSGGHTIMTSAVMPEEWGEALSALRAPLGVLCGPRQS